MAFIIEPCPDPDYDQQVYDDIEDACEGLQKAIEQEMETMDLKEGLDMRIKITFKEGPASLWTNDPY